MARSLARPFEVLQEAGAHGQALRHIVYDFGVNNDSVGEKAASFDAATQDAVTRANTVTRAHTGQPMIRRLQVEGFTDNVGKDERNFWLAERRARSARSDLERRLKTIGTFDPASRITSAGGVAERAPGDNLGEEGRALNRSVVISERLEVVEESDLERMSPEDMRRAGEEALPGLLDQAAGLVAEEERPIVELLKRPDTDTRYLTASQVDAFTRAEFAGDPMRPPPVDLFVAAAGSDLRRELQLAVGADLRDRTKADPQRLVAAIREHVGLLNQGVSHASRRNTTKPGESRYSLVVRWMEQQINSPRSIYAVIPKQE